MPRKIISEESISNSEALEILLRKFGEEPDLQIQKRALEYLRAVSKCRAEAAHKSVEDLLEIGFPREAAILLVNLVPNDASEARALLSPLYSNIDTDVLEKAIEIIKKCGEEQHK